METGPDRPIAWRAGAATCLAALLLLGPLALAPSGEIWSGWAPANCAEYCEGSHLCGPLGERPAIQQPLNTVSNFAYLFVGLLVGLRRRDLAGWSFAAAMALLCVGSALFHASATRSGQWLDVAGMFVALNAVVGFALHAAGVVPFARSLPAFLVLDALLAAFKWSIPTIPVLGLQGGTIFVLLVLGARRGAPSWAWVIGPPLVFFLGFGVRELDVRHVGCDPESWLYQGHTLWHFTSAAYLWGTFVALERLAARARPRDTRAPQG